MATIHVVRVEQYPVSQADLAEAQSACLGRVDMLVDGQGISGHVVRDNHTGQHRVDLPGNAREALDAPAQHEVQTAGLDAFLAEAERQARLTAAGPQRVTPSWARGETSARQEVQR